MNLIKLQEYTSSLELIILIAVVTSTISLALLVYLNDRNSATNIIYLLLSLVTVLWLIVGYVNLQLTESVAIQLFLHRLGIFFAAPLSATFFLFSYIFPDQSMPRKGITYAVVLITLLMMGINISPYAFTSLAETSTNPGPVPGLGLIPFAVFSTLFSVFAVYNLIVKTKRATGALRRQRVLVLVGMLAMLTLITTTVLLPIALSGNATFLPLLPLYALIFLGTTAYAITKYKLFNAKLLVTQALTFILWVVLFGRIFTEKDNPAMLVADIGIFLTVLVFGILLIRSVIREVEAREEIQTLAEHLKRANERLKGLDKLKSEFLSIASHQLRSPLTAIGGYASMILEGSFGKLSDSVSEAVNRIKNSSALMRKSVEDFLNVSRIEQGKMDYDMTDFNLGELVQTVTDEMRPLVVEKELKLVTHFNPHATYPVHADLGKVKQVIINVIDNAIKYTPHGSITVDVEHNTSRNVQIVTVSDTGVGFSEETLNKMFGMFTRAKNASRVNVSGTGVGLYVARKLIEAHNGTLSARSDGEGKGSTFTIELKGA
jgi:signal transduction histidine kinase